MKDSIQKSYKQYLTFYVDFLYGGKSTGLYNKLEIYSTLFEQHNKFDEGLCGVEPLLEHFLESIEVDLHLSLAKLLEPTKRSGYSIFAFLEFCKNNCKIISWSSGTMTEDFVHEQLSRLQNLNGTINKIIGRRDSFFAHLDKKYCLKQNAISEDFPLEQSKVIELTNCVITIIQQHQWCLKGRANVGAPGHFKTLVEQMMQKLTVGRGLP